MPASLIAEVTVTDPTGFEPTKLLLVDGVA